MSLILSGTDGLSDVDGSAATPAIRGTDANTGIFFGTDIIGFSEGGVEAMRINASGNVVMAGTLTTAAQSIAKASLPTGSVLQVVQGTSTSQVTTTSGTWVTTGLAASITPTSSTSNILVLVSGGMEGGSGGTGTQKIGFKVYRGASSIEASSNGKVLLLNPDTYVPINYIALDSPATTSSTTYTLYFNRLFGTTTASFCRDSGSTANIILMEISA